MDLLRTRGRLLIKRAYGDWGRFHRYRRPMMENGIDLFQLYSVGIQQKNRADVRLAIDAMETVFTRPNIDTLRHHFGRQRLHRIDPQAPRLRQIHRSASACAQPPVICCAGPATSSFSTRPWSPRNWPRWPTSCNCLTRVSSCGGPSAQPSKRAKRPVFAGRLKQIMLGLDSSFNEANYGFPQFRAFLGGPQGPDQTSRKHGLAVVRQPCATRCRGSPSACRRPPPPADQALCRPGAALPQLSA